MISVGPVAMQYMCPFNFGINIGNNVIIREITYNQGNWEITLSYFTELTTNHDVNRRIDIDNGKVKLIC